MRLIDVDVLMEKANSDGAYDYVDAKQISEAPTVDAVSVVRCRECKYLGFCGDATNLEVMGFYGYCSRGERKEGADNDT